jgi:hypothetical protein
MTFHPERYIGAVFIALVALTIAPPVLDRWAVSHLPPAVQAAIEDRLPGSQAIRVESRAEGGQTVYDLHMRQGHERYVVRVTPEGRVLRSSHAVGILGLPQEKWSRSYGCFGLCIRSNSSGETYPRDECRRTRL